VSRHAGLELVVAVIPVGIAGFFRMRMAINGFDCVQIDYRGPLRMLLEDAMHNNCSPLKPIVTRSKRDRP
jgi:hypothetical protein